jgi:hypothetical protein
MIRNGISRQLPRLVLLSMLVLAAQVCASDAEPLSLGGKLHAGDPVVDAATFIKDQDQRNALTDSIAADRFAMAADLQNATALPTDVKKFFGDRADVFALDATIHQDRRQLRFDVKPQTGPLIKPVKGGTDLNAAVTQFFKDFDARVAAEGAVDADYKALKISVLQQDKAGVTSNANAFFHDRFNQAQARLNEAADVFNIKKIVKFKGQKLALVKPSRGNDLTGHTKMFLDDRAKWLSDGDAITAARNNMRSALGTSSLEASVLTWLNARRTRHIGGLQLALDRFAMKVDVGLAKRKDPVAKNVTGKGEGLEDQQDQPSPDLDESSDDIGEK